MEHDLSTLTRDEVQDGALACRLYRSHAEDPALAAAVLRLYPEVDGWAAVGHPIEVFAAWPPLVRLSVWTTIARGVHADGAAWLRARRLAAALTGPMLEAQGALRVVR